MELVQYNLLVKNTWYINNMKQVFNIQYVKHMQYMKYKVDKMNKIYIPHIEGTLKTRSTECIE